ncbi:MAG: DUF4783 domain-containing protein [Acidobacteriota bacterium]
MKWFITASFLLIVSSGALAQHGLPQGSEQTLARIEAAFQKGDMHDLNQYMETTVKMRLDDTVYTAITDVYARQILNDYLQAKKSVEFRFTAATSDNFLIERSSTYSPGGKTEDVTVQKPGVRPATCIGTGMLSFEGNGGRVNVPVNVWLHGPMIYALDISKNSQATVFFEHQNR